MLYDLRISFAGVTYWGHTDKSFRRLEYAASQALDNGAEWVQVIPREWDTALAGWRHDPPMIYVRS